ncbi:MAG: putative porin [Bacteroidetes bacterium]|nr:putative porin [Fibrella sp.]
MTVLRRLGLLICWLLLFIGTAYAQVPTPGTFGGLPNRPGSFTSTPGATNGTGGKTGGSIIDDSTKTIYGPSTTRFILEPDVFNNRRKLYTVDTVLGEGHRYNFVQRNQNRYQDLGNLGTALRPVFYEEPPQIGAQTGYYVFAPYQYQTDQIRYFNTRSPFTRLYLALGGREQNILGFDFTQNVTPRWNLGFNLQRFTSIKQFGTSGSNSDPQKYAAQNWGFVGHSNYRSKDDKYTLLLHFNHMNHTTADQGGVLPTVRPGQRDSLVLDYAGQARLNGANGQAGPGTREIRNDFHVYQQYKLAQGFQLYDRFDIKRQINGFDDYNLAENQRTAGFYPRILYDSTRTAQDVRSLILDNAVGIKGDYKAFNYRTFLRARNYSQTGTYNVPVDAINLNRANPTYRNRGTEIYLGGWLGYYFPDSTSFVTAELEYLLGGGFRLAGRIESKLFTAGYTSILAAPTLIQTRYRSNHFAWDTTGEFGLRGTQHFYGLLNLKVRNITLTPGLDYSLLTNYTYFDAQARTAQFRGGISIVRAGLGYGFQRGKFSASGQGYYTLASREDLLRQPRLFINTRFQYELLYAKVLYIQTGVDLHYKSAYFADAYMPVTQQFYLQNTQKVEGEIVADVFANLRVNRVRLFVKMAYVNKGFLSPGYYVTPGYLSQRRSFGFGVDWYLFD